MKICSVFLELLYADRHGDANSRISETYLCERIKNCKIKFLSIIKFIRNYPGN
jgi:hypothetical protein